MKFLAILFIGIFAHSLYAKPFSGQYTEFELPPGWDCSLEGSEWVCQSSDKDRKKEAIIILAAKYRGEQDSLEAYKAYLKQPKSFTLPGGKQQISEAKTVETKQINGHPWIDALHLASEVPGFYTRYLATVKDNLGIAVTFSVSKDHYNDYQDLFDKIVVTLRVFSQNGTGNFVAKAKTAENLGDNGGTIGGTDQNLDIGMNKQKKKSSSGDDSLILLALAGLGIGIFIYMKKRRK